MKYQTYIDVVNGKSKCTTINYKSLFIFPYPLGHATLETALLEPVHTMSPK